MEVISNYRDNTAVILWRDRMINVTDTKFHRTADSLWRHFQRKQKQKVMSRMLRGWWIKCGTNGTCFIKNLHFLTSVWPFLRLFSIRLNINIYSPNAEWMINFCITSLLSLSGLTDSWCTEIIHTGAVRQMVNSTIVCSDSVLSQSWGTISKYIWLSAGTCSVCVWVSVK